MNTVLVAFIMAAVAGLSVVIGMLALGIWAPLMLGFFAGVVVGDVTLGLQIGAVCALMALGFYTYGGATIPDYNTGAMFGVVVASQGQGTGEAISQGLIVATAMALLMSLFDIFGRAGTTVFQHGGDRALANRKLKSFEAWHLAGTISWFLGRFIPVFIGMLFVDRYQLVSDFVSQVGWFRNGLSVVGGALPAVGFALLLSYMDIANYWPYMLVGYVLFAYLGIPTVGLAIIGMAAAGIYMKGKKEQAGA
jgi:PTS system mannose-specific IIC component